MIQHVILLTGAASLAFAIYLAVDQALAGWSRAGALGRKLAYALAFGLMVPVCIRGAYQTSAGVPVEALGAVLGVATVAGGYAVGAVAAVVAVLVHWGGGGAGWTAEAAGDVANFLGAAAIVWLWERRKTPFEGEWGRLTVVGLWVGGVEAAVGWWGGGPETRAALEQTSGVELFFAQLLCTVLMGGLIWLQTERRRSSQTLQAALASMLDIFLLVDPKDGRVLDCNPAALKAYGCDREELLSKSIRDLRRPGEEELVREQMARAEREGILFETQHRRRDGALFPVEVTSAAAVVDGRRRLVSVVRDLTGHRRMEEELRSLNRELEKRAAERAAEALDLYNKAPCGYHSLAPDGTVLQMNDTELNWLGYRREEVEGRMHLTELLSPDEAAVFGRRFPTVREQQAEHSFEATMLRRDGSPLWVFVRARPVTGADGELLGTRAVTLNISERKRVEVALQRNYQRLNSIIEATNAGTWEWDVASGRLSLNERWAEMLGYTLEEITPATLETWRSLCHPDDLETFRALLESHVRGLTSFFEREMRVRHKDGTWVWVLNRGKVTHRDEQGNALTVQGVHLDITGIKRTSEALRKFSQAIESSPSIIVITDARGVVEYVNPAFSLITGYAEAEILGATLSVLHSGVHTREFYAGLWSEISAGRSWRGEFCNRKKSGELYWESAAIAPVRDDAGEIAHFVAVKEDITVRRKFEEDLRLAKEAADSANRAKSTFLANMSHEIRTPMNSILGFSNMLLRDRDLTDAQRRGLGTIVRSGEHLLEIISDILEMARIESGKAALNKSVVDVHGLVADVQGMFTLRAQSKGLDFHVRRAESVPRHLLLDGTKFLQVLINLLSNAVKFTREGSVFLEVSTVPGPNGELRLAAEVRDTGEGISPHALPHLFDPFFQTGAKAGAVGGTGLGLPISREFVRLMGGALTVSSRVGEGSVFRFDVGAEPVEAAPADDAPAELTLPRLVAEHEGFRVLVADDEAANRDLLRQVLGPAGFDVSVAADGAEAVAQCEVALPGLVLMDMRMPVMDGYEAIRTLRSSHPELPIVALSAGVFSEDRERALGCGATAFVPKPFALRDLLATIARCAGVRFVDQAPAAAAPPRGGSAVLSAEAFALLPSDLVSSLREAVSNAEYDQMLALVEQLAVRDPGLAQAVRERVEQFDYEPLLQALG